MTTGGPYTIDLSAPEVTNVDSVATSGGAIGESEVVNVEITQLLVGFDEAMDATLAEGRGNYLLVAGGLDGTLDTTVCGLPQGDDQSVSVDSASYAAQTSTICGQRSDRTRRTAVTASLCALLWKMWPAIRSTATATAAAATTSRAASASISTPPTVTLVHSLADTGDGVLSEDEPTNVAITELLVSFSEEMLGGDSTASFLLVEGGGDGMLDTTACGPLAGDDASVTIDSAAYSSPTSTIALNGGAALPDGEYRLLVCATLTDLGGNALDDADAGDGNDDLVRTFTVDTVRPTNPTAVSSSTHPYARLVAGDRRSPRSGAARPTGAPASPDTR